jgi:signal transduction histidine kinase/CheY-like chemotaxis protein
VCGSNINWHHCLEHKESPENQEFQKIPEAVAPALNVELLKADPARSEVPEIEKKNLSLHHLTQSIWEMDLLTGTISRDAAFAQLIGSETEGHSESLKWWIDHIHPSHRSRVLNGLRDAVENKSEWSAQYLIQNVAGQFFEVSDHGKVVLDPAGRPIRMIGSLIDSTAQMKIEEELEEARVKADAASRAKTQFIANVTHEIRTPLGVILGFSDLLLELGPLSREQVSYVETIKRNAEQLSRIADDILDISKIDAQKIEVENLKFSLTEVLRDLRTTFDIVARRHGLDFKVEPIGALPEEIVTDPTRLRQILYNIIGNAIKFTTNGSVLVSVEFRKRPAGLGHLDIIVADTGRGIDPEEESRLFQPFMQADNSITRKFGGTGLGLVLSRQLAKAMKGDVLILESTKGLGSKFLITIPVDVPPNVDTRSSSTETPLLTTIKQEPRLSRVGILLVEDSPDNQVLISRMLIKEGAIVDLASSGLEGVQKAQEKDYDLVLMDIQMPGLDGYQAAKRLRDSGFRRPMVAITAHAMRTDREKAILAGFDEHLPKPINRTDLVDVVAHYTLKENAGLYRENPAGSHYLH